MGTCTVAAKYSAGVRCCMLKKGVWDMALHIRPKLKALQQSLDYVQKGGEGAMRAWA